MTPTPEQESQGHPRQGKTLLDDETPIDKSNIQMKELQEKRSAGYDASIFTLIFKTFKKPI